jgi:hypothetical protein
LDRGANPRLLNKKRERAEHLAASAGHDDISALLKQHKSGISWFFN